MVEGEVRLTAIASAQHRASAYGNARDDGERWQVLTPTIQLR